MVVSMRTNSVPEESLALYLKYNGHSVRGILNSILNSG